MPGVHTLPRTREGIVAAVERSIADAALKSIKLLRNGTIKTYPGYAHGMLTVHAEVLNADLLAFVKG